MAITKIAQIDVGAGGATSLDFTLIPQNYTDLMLLLSLRDANTALPSLNDAIIRFNGSSTSYTGNQLSSSATTVSAGTLTSILIKGIPNTRSTASGFANVYAYIPNYTISASKMLIAESTYSAAAGATVCTTIGTWANNAAITSISILSATATGWTQYTSASLYGVSNANATGATVAAV